MLFSSTVFLFLFLPITLLFYFIPWKHNRKTKNAILLIASVLFYAWGEPSFVFPLLLGVIFNYFFGKAMGEVSTKTKSQRKTILVVSIIYNLAILFVFKYLNFTLSVVSHFANVRVTSIALPIGISFYTFQVMSYIFDVYYGTVTPQKNIFKLALYIMMFPQLVAGPIVRYESIADEIDNRIETRENFEEGIRRFIVGLGKKVLLADVLGEFADQIFALDASNELVAITAWVGMICYYIELYFDFSGYSDMAIGLGRCFGFHFKENFNYPFISTSVTEYWKRWHMSLTSWFRDYVYIPMGGNRVSIPRHYVNIFVVWALTGIWHGANWTFLVWGLLCCIFQLLEKSVPFMKKMPRGIGHVYTLFAMCITHMIFRAESLGYAGQYFLALFGKNGFADTNALIYLKSCLVIVIIAAIGTTPWLPKLKAKISGNNALENTFEVFSMAALIVIFVMVIMTSISGGYSPFIYFNF